MPESTELVSVLVPRDLVLEVYQLITQRTAGGDAPPPESGKDDGFREGWTPQLVQRMYTESPGNMQAILEYLAEHAGDVVPADALIGVLTKSRGDEANSMVLGGTLGAFGRRVANRYEMETWPFHVWWDGNAGQCNYKMSSQVAAAIRS